MGFAKVDLTQSTKQLEVVGHGVILGVIVTWDGRCYYDKSRGISATDKCVMTKSHDDGTRA